MSIKEKPGPKLLALCTFSFLQLILYATLDMSFAAAVFVVVVRVVVVIVVIVVVVVVVVVLNVRF